MGSEIQVTVFCLVYNHAPFLRDCLEGFVAQKTDFNFEVWVHDDASTDESAEIIREYQFKYPHRIKAILQTENQHSKGIKISKTYLYPKATGKYVAFCEGDDYWTDPGKLQKQYDAMERHPEVDICAHRAVKLHAVTNQKLQEIAPQKEDGIIPVEDVIAGGGEYVATNSLFYRAELLTREPRFREFYTIDYSLQIYGALRGGMLYLNDEMSVYRFMVPGSWTERRCQSAERTERTLAKLDKMLALLDEDTEGLYDRVIHRKSLELEMRQLMLQERHKEVLSGKYREVWKAYPLKQKAKLFVKAYLPWGEKLYRRLMRS